MQPDSPVKSILQKNMNSGRWHHLEPSSTFWLACRVARGPREFADVTGLKRFEWVECVVHGGDIKLMVALLQQHMERL